jgi:hypothetical protein
MDNLHPHAIMPFISQLSKSMLLALQQQMIINFTQRVFDKKYEINQESLQHMHKNLIEFLKVDANLQISHPEIWQGVFKATSIKDIPTTIALFPVLLSKYILKRTVKKNISLMNEKYWKEIILSGTISAMSRLVIKSIYESQLQVNNRLNLLYIGAKESKTIEVLQNTFSYWHYFKTEYISQLHCLNVASFDLIVIDYQLSSSKENIDLEAIKSLVVNPDNVFLLDYIHEVDDPKLYQCLEQASQLELIEINEAYQNFNLGGTKINFGFVSKLITNPSLS